MEIVFELADIESTANKFLEVCKNYKVFAFSGDLGAGKTTFINALCKNLALRKPLPVLRILLSRNIQPMLMKLFIIWIFIA